MRLLSDSSAQLHQQRGEVQTEMYRGIGMRVLNGRRGRKTLQRRLTPGLTITTATLCVKHYQFFCFSVHLLSTPSLAAVIEVVEVAMTCQVSASRAVDAGDKKDQQLKDRGNY